MTGQYSEIPDFTLESRRERLRDGALGLASHVHRPAAASIALIGAAAWRSLPRFKATTHLSYGALLASLAKLWKRHGSLRRATWSQGLLSVGFSVFWSTLAVRLHGEPFHLGAAAAGAFGLADAVLPLAR